MKWFSDLKIKQKLSILIVVFSLGLIIVGSAGYLALKQSSEYTDQIYRNNLTEVTLAYENRLYIDQIRTDVLSLMLTTEDRENKQLQDRIAATRKLYAEELAKYDAMPLSPAQQKNLQAVKDTIAAYRDGNNATIELAMIIAGWSDIIGKYSALADWKISQIVNKEFYCDVTVQMVKKSIQTCMDNIEKIKQRDPQAIKNLMEGLVLTGIAMSFVGISRPASGSEHHLAHYWEMQFLFAHKKAIFHGTKVGIGTTLTTRLYELLRAATVDFSKAEEKARLFDEKKWRADVECYYQQCASEIIALSEKDQRNSLTEKLERLAIIRQNWPEIEQVLSEVAPSATVKKILHEADAPVKPQDVGIDGQMAVDAVRMAKEVRNRYTILTLLADLGLLDEFSQEIGRELVRDSL